MARVRSSSMKPNRRSRRRRWLPTIRTPRVGYGRSMRVGSLCDAADRKVVCDLHRGIDYRSLDQLETVLRTRPVKITKKDPCVYVRTNPFLVVLQRDAMLGLMEKVVNIDSGSYDKAGVDAVGEVFEEFFKSHGIEVERLPRDVSGDIFRAGIPGPGNAPIVLMGHRDTVFSKGEAARRPFTIRDGRAYGPGVTDMKGGLVLNAFVL